MSEINPYRSPVETREVESHYGFRPLQGWARTLTFTLSADILCLAVEFFLAASMQILMRSGMMYGRTFAANYQTLYLVISIVASIKMLFRVINMVLLLSFLFRANENSRKLEAGRLTFSPWGAIGWWFVPLANLILPYKIVKEIYLASDPHSSSVNWMTAPPPRVVLTWWLLFMVPILLMVLFPLMPAQIQNWLSVWLHLGSYILTIASGVLLIRIVQEIAHRQSLRAELLAARADGYKSSFAD